MMTKQLGASKPAMDSRRSSARRPIPARSLTIRASCRVASLLSLTTLAACDRGLVESDGYVVRDSAGVRIVENTDWAWVNGTPWRIDAEPAVTIGAVDGAPEYQLYRVRGALRLDDGTIVVADGASHEFRFFDAEGRHMRSVGGTGEGPGQYHAITLFSRYGADSLVAYDGRLERLTVLANDGSFGHTFARPDFGDGFPYLLGFFGDRSILAQYGAGVRLEEEPGGVRANHSVILRRSVASDIDTIGSALTSEAFVSARHATLISMPFGRRAVWATSDTLFHHGASDTYAIETYAPDGTLLRIARVARGPLVLTQPMIDAHIASAERIEDPDARRRMREIYDEVPYPSTLPAYDDLIADRAGNVWAAEYRTDDDDPRFWMVFDEGGRWLGRIETPAGLEIFEIGADYVLGVERDAMDIERVVVYSIVKPG